MYEVKSVLRKNGKVAFALDGLPGTDPNDQITRAYRRGSRDDWDSATEWEMYQVGKMVEKGNLDWDRVTFYRQRGSQYVETSVSKPVNW